MCSMSTHAIASSLNPRKHEQNIIDDLLSLIEKLRQQIATMKSGNFSQEEQEFVGDVHVHLCNILKKLVAAPLHGRLLVVSPQTYVSANEKAESLRTNFVEAWSK